MEISNLIFDNIDTIIKKLKITTREPGEKPRFSRLSDEDRMVSYPAKVKIANRLVSIKAVNFDDVKNHCSLIKSKDGLMFEDNYLAGLSSVVVREKAFCSNLYEIKTCGKKLAFNLFNTDVIKCGNIVYFKMKVKNFGSVFIKFKVEPTYSDVPVINLDELVTA